VEQKLWQVWVDTGGTFTDCLAVDPDGRLHRAKVLSSAALRARIDQVVEPGTITLAGDWKLPDGFFRGAEISVMGSKESQSQVVGFTAKTARLELSRALVGAERGAQCELRAAIEAPVLAAHLVTQTPLDQPLPAIALRLASTRGTNALLERRGAPTALFITAGFGDLLEIGNQQRPDLFALEIDKPAPFYSQVVEVEERINADGSVLQPINREAIREQARQALAAGISCAAVALMHSYRNPEHEETVAELLQQEGYTHVSCSSALAPLIKLLPRAKTAVVDAYLAPIIGTYLERVAESFASGSLHVMTSAGGLVRDRDFRAKDALLSGPAGGVVGAARAARLSQIRSIIAFDMGGTSTDVARWDGDYEYLFEHQVGDAHLVAPALAIESVAAGGGSICSFDGTRLRVGPESAGADPGPACYGAGGPLAVTDVNLILGRVVPERFEIPITREAAEQQLQLVLDEVARRRNEQLTIEEAAQGFLQIANERMASAIRRISVRKGHDPRSATLVAFGGAGPQHACAVAELLQMELVLVPPDASLLSAGGLGHAVVERFAQCQVLEPLDQCFDYLPGRFAELANQARRAVMDEGVNERDVELRRCLAHLRLFGQDATLEVEWQLGADLIDCFAARYTSTYGYLPPSRPIEVESLRVVASARSVLLSPATHPEHTVEAVPTGKRSLFAAGRWHNAAVFERSQMEPGSLLLGPALIQEQHSVTVVEPGWYLMVDGARALMMKRSGHAR
jgi:5-oxoprolinase (ATP-hydrolysing)